jgi:transposase-like protein
MAIDLKLIDKLLADYKNPEDIIGENGLLKQLTKALLERAMQAELTEHLGYEKHDPAGHNSGNSRNGATTKTLKGDFGEMPLETPRDRNGSYEPKIIGKSQTRFTGFDDKIISMYARGMSTREAAKKAGIEGVTHQMLRRTCSTYMAQLTTVKDVQAHLRHSSAKTTLEHYIKSVPASVRVAVESLDHLLKAVPADQRESAN